MTSTLAAADRPLADSFDVALLDLDGVVYVGKDAVPGAPAALAAARDAGMQLAFVTNNAARPPKTVASHLTELGIAAEPAEVITSSQAAARYLAEHLEPGATVLVLGTTGLYEALTEQGLRSTDRAEDSVAAVVQGYSPEMNWALLAEGAVALNAGALWVATNVDPTVPSPRGPLPGNGSLVAAMKLATGKEPLITGKPDPTMHRETLIRTGAERPVVVGDRLDTDIEGANAVGCASLLVFSGVTDVADLLAAPPALRPTYIGGDVAALLRTHPQPELGSTDATCGAWTVRADGERLVLTSSQAPSDETRAAGSATGANGGDHGNDDGGDDDGDDGAGWTDSRLDAVRALCAAAWELLPEPTDGRTPELVAAPGDTAAAALLRWVKLTN